MLRPFGAQGIREPILRDSLLPVKSGTGPAAFQIPAQKVFLIARTHWREYGVDIQPSDAGPSA